MPTETIFAEERQSKILSMLKTKNKLLVNDLCAVFSVSPATIRNDLNDLEKQGLLKRTHGGAIPALKIGFEQNSMQKDFTHQEEKNLIAMKASELVENGDTIALDTGSTTYCLAQKLTDKKNLTVVTTDIRIASLLENLPNITIILAGGKVRSTFSCTVGSITNSILRSLHVDKTFIATNSVNPFGELCTPDIEQAEVKKSLIAMGTQVILMTDSSKFGTHSFSKFGNLSDVDILVTDSAPDHSFEKLIREQNLEIEVL